MKHMLYILSMFVIITIYTGKDFPEGIFKPLLDVAQKLDRHQVPNENPPEEFKDVIAEYKILLQTRNLSKDAACERVAQLAQQFETALEQYLKNKKDT